MSTPRTSRERRPVTALVALANAGRPRRPPRARHGHSDDPFANVKTAQLLLDPLQLSWRVEANDLPVLSAMASEVTRIAEALARGETPPDPDILNAVGAEARARPLLDLTGRTPAASNVWQYSGAPAEMAHRVICELGSLDPSRLKECARAECTLLFYDTTRPGTQRWHAEDPCGWHERQTRHRTKR
ncbi:MAG: CGNR zinc finger domain-containing protein [Acidimicrobiales bacterium]